MGQSLLAIGALALFMFVALNVNRTYVTSTSQSVEQQLHLDAVNYAQSLSEMVYGYSSRYGGLDTIFVNLNDVNNPSRRLSHGTALRDSLFATVVLEAEEEMIHDVNGRYVNITVFARQNGTMVRLAGSRVALVETAPVD